MEMRIIEDINIINCQQWKLLSFLAEPHCVKKQNVCNAGAKTK